MEERVQDSLREAEKLRLLCQAELNQHTWLSHQIGLLSAPVDRFEIALRHRLEGHATPILKEVVSAVKDSLTDVATDGKA